MQAATAAFEQGSVAQGAGGRACAAAEPARRPDRGERQELAELESLDNGKPVAYARQIDVPLTVAHFRYFAGWPTKIEGEVIPVSAPNMLCYTRKEPVGVCGQIIPGTSR